LKTVTPGISLAALGLIFTVGSSPTQSCMSCSFSFAQPGPTDIRAKWAERTDLAVNPNP
jgi:hypothetical protein